MIKEMRPDGIHMGLPCGTCSRARDKPLPEKFRNDFFDPPPLRDANNLLGFDHLTGANAAKVQAANDLYRWAIRILFLCYTLKLNISIENPERSWLWGVLTTLVKEFGDKGFLEWFANLSRVTFHSCMHGGQRAKNTRLLATSGLYDSLAAECNGSHDHAPWTIQRHGSGLKYDTASEAEYPQLLCTRMADLLATQVNLPADACFLSQSKQARHVLGQHVKQPPPLVPEFSRIIEVDAQPTQPGYKLLTSQIQGESPEMGYTDTSKEAGSKRVKKSFRVGVQKSPQEFFQEAKQVQHPMNPSKALPEVVRTAIFDNLTMDPIELAKSRMRAVIMIKEMAKDLEEDERRIKQQCSQSVASVLANKRIALWETLLKASEFPDMEIVDLVKQGAPLTGQQAPSPLFPLDWKPATTSTEELVESSTWRRLALQAQSRKEDNSGEDAALNEATMEEVALGHLQGPFTEEQMDKKFGRGKWVFSKRFALQQGTPENPKIRVIDDCRRSGLNSAYTTTCKLELLDMDVLACAMVGIAAAHATGHVDLGTSSSGELVGELHPAVCNQTWLGRTLDLSKAYKQVPLSEDAERMCVLGYFHKGAWRYFTTSRLPFGATSAVYVFNRISRSLHHILSRFLHVVCTCFYDDFPALSGELGAQLVSKGMSLVLNLLGWDHAQLGQKAIDFAPEFSALGITVRLRNLHRGSFVLANKEGRIPKIIQMLKKVQAKKALTRHEAAEIQGHLNFASGFFVSKALRFLLSQFDSLARAPNGSVETRLDKLCALTESILLALPPREFDATAMAAPHLLFTDGAWENKVGTAGLVFVDAISGETIVQTIEVPQELISLWESEVGDQLICQIELFAYLAARIAFSSRTLNRSVIAWLDNESARYAASKGTAVSQSLMAMTRVLQSLELKAPSLTWVERVASHSNMPSRGQGLRASQMFHGTYVSEPVRVDAKIIEHIVKLTKDPLANLPVL